MPMEVVLPHPFGPRRPKVLFFLISKLILFTAIVVLNFFIRFLTCKFIQDFDARCILSFIAIPDPKLGILPI